MKTLITLVGIIFMVVGIGALTYRGYTYTTQEKVAQLGDIQVTAENRKTVYFPPLLGGLSLAAGIVLVVIGRAGGKG